MYQKAPANPESLPTKKVKVPRKRNVLKQKYRPTMQLLQATLFPVAEGTGVKRKMFKVQLIYRLNPNDK